MAATTAGDVTERQPITNLARVQHQDEIQHAQRDTERRLNQIQQQS